MSNPMRVTLEIGPKGKKVVAVAADWPGLERGAKNGELAVAKLRTYLPRYAQVAKLAGLSGEFDPLASLEVVEEYAGVGSTDFWGISFAFSSMDKQELTTAELERELTLMQACWAFFDGVRGRVSAELQKGPRGGGRDRDHIVRHVFAGERDWGKMIGLAVDVEGLLTAEGLAAHRATYCDTIRAYHAQGKMAGKIAKWPLRYFIRHTAYHAMDHAWEMEDKDLTGREG